MNKSKISMPKTSVFKNRAKEADFWEKHFDKAWTRGKSTKVTFARNLSETLNIRLDPGTLYNVKNQARKKGLGPTQLIRMWIMEKIEGKNTQPVAT